VAFAALTIDITAKLANLEQGLQRTEQQLSGFASRASAIGAGISAAFGAIAGVAAFDAVLGKLRGTVDQLGALDDAAQSTGASVESLSSLLNTLAPTGVTLETITDAAGKLTRAMNGADDETRGAGEAFKVLGVSTRDSAGNLRAVDDVLIDVAKALARYEDGTNKTAIAQAIFGKTGAALLPMLKDLAEFQRQGASVTSEQAKAAADLADAWGALRVAGDRVVQEALGPVIVKLAELAKTFGEARKAGLGFFDSLQSAAGVDSLLPRAIEAQKKAIDDLRKSREAEARLRGRNAGLQDDGALAAIDADIARRQKVLDVLQGRANVLDRSRLQGEAGGDPELARLLRGQTLGLGQAPALTGGGGAGAGKGIKEARDAYAELNALVRQADIDDRLKREAEAAKQLAQQLERAADAALRRLSENDRAEEDADKALRAEVERWKNVADPARQYRLELERIAVLEAAGQFDSADEAAAARRETLLKMLDTIGSTKTKAEEAGNIARDLGLTFESAFEKAVIGGQKFSAVLQGIAQDITRLVLRKTVTEPFAKLLTDNLPALLGFGGGATAATSAASNGSWDILPASVPAAVKSAGGAPSVVNYVTVSGEVSRAEVFNAVAAANAQTMGAVYGSMNRNGMLAKAQG
jgi:hypothetical protein